MAKHSFAVTWDYRCPFAARAHDHVIEALLSGADWDVEFIPFSLGQVHVAEGEPDIWNRPGDDSGLLALQAGVAVRDIFPDRFLGFHRAMFDARHKHGLALRDPDVVRQVLTSPDVDVDPEAVFDDISSGRPLEAIRKEHERAVADHQAFGVPTFIAGGEAAFIRLMNGSDGDGAESQRIVERMLGVLVCWPDLNEFKHTSVPR